MFNISLRYIFFIFLLFLFGACFFSSEVFMPMIRNWKSNKLYNLSKIYQDESITNEPALLQDGLRKARISTLLAPSDENKKNNYLTLLYRLEPTEAILNWSDSYSSPSANSDEKIKLIERCLETLSNSELSSTEHIIAGRISLKHLNFLENDKNWFNNPDQILLSAKVHAQTGKAKKAKEQILQSISKYSNHVESIFFLTRIIVHLKDKNDLSVVGGKLAELSTRRTPTGKEAIRHLTLLHLLQPLSPESLKKCIELLKANPHSEAIDFMRIYALLYQLLENHAERKKITEECSQYFNLKEKGDHLIFCNWLSSIGASSEILNFLSASQAKTDESLFQLRMNALVKTNDLESIYMEVNNSPLIPLRWRLAIEARAHTIQANYLEAEKILNRLLVSLGNDPRHVRSICNYLETANDIRGLTHILEQLKDHPVHQVFSLKKLLQHRSSSATIEELLGWMTKLSKLQIDDPSFSQTHLYFELLDPLLQSPSVKLNRLLEKAFEKYNQNKISINNKIILALAHLRNQEVDKALVVIGPIREWRNWQKTRPAWTFIAAQIFKLNNDSEKGLILEKSVDMEKISRAEIDSLKVLFSKSFSNI